MYFSEIGFKISVFFWLKRTEFEPNPSLERPIHEQSVFLHKFLGTLKFVNSNILGRFSGPLSQLLANFQHLGPSGIDLSDEIQYRRSDLSRYIVFPC